MLRASCVLEAGGRPACGVAKATPDEAPVTHGYLSLLQLLGSAAADRRLTNAQCRALTVLAGFAGRDGTCCVPLARVAELLGIERQGVKRALRAAERLGYLASERQYLADGAEGAKAFAFNLALEGAVACPGLSRGGAS